MMNGNEPKIEIFAPFNAALELTKRILFRPFDLKKWCVIGFAAFLAKFSGGVHSNGFNPNWRNKDWHWHAWSTWQTNFAGADHMPVWAIPLIIVGVAVMLAIVFVLMWIGARGRFIFIDCIVRNRAAIVAPWHEFQEEGNSFFLFTLLIALVVIAIVAMALLPMFLPAILHGNHSHVGLGLTIGLGFWVCLILLLALGWALVSHLMVPVMYRRRCRAGEAFSAVVSLISANPGPLILYFLFLFVLVLASAMIACVSTCVTCCITAIPYIGTVILLPIFVALTSFTLFFLRQFGDQYDVWAGLEASSLTSTPSSPPPPFAPPVPPTAPPPGSPPLV